MPRETKSNGQKDILDRFYTPAETVQKCLSILDLSQYDCIIEPSAGTGAFIEQLPKDVRLYAYDISSESTSIERADWFKVDKNIYSNFSNILVVGNPPFGQQNTLAINFFNESAKFANTIAFILPRSFKKDSVQNRLDLSFELIQEIDLESCEFYLKDKVKIKVPCVFQVWTKSSKLRKKVSLKATSNLFDFTDKEHADFRIQRVGGNAGKASFDLSRSPSSNYFIKNKSQLSNKEFVDFINQLIFPTIEFTTGPKSLSRGEMIAVIEENFDF